MKKSITGEFAKRLFDTLVESTDDLVYVVGNDGRYDDVCEHDKPH